MEVSLFWVVQETHFICVCAPPKHRVLYSILDYMNREQLKKKKIPSPLAIKLCPAPVPLLIEKRDEFMYLLDPSGLTGLEPATSALTGRCSDQLNYNPREIRDIAEN